MGVPEAEQLDRAIHAVLRSLTLDSRARSTELGLGDLAPIDLEVLNGLHHVDACTASNLVQTLGAKLTTLQSSLDRLEKRGLIVRDAQRLKGRSVALSLSGIGREHYDAIHAQNLANCEVMLAMLPKEERAAFVNAMSQIAEGLSVHKAKQSG